MDREQIIKALECCTRGRKSKDDRPCLGCPYNECNIVGGTSERQRTGTCQGWLMKDALSLIKELTEENERLRVACDKQNLWAKVLKAEAQMIPIQTERIRVADAITDEIYTRYRQGECFDYGGAWNCDKFKALLEDIRGKYIPEEKWEDRDC